MEKEKKNINTLVAAVALFLLLMVVFLTFLRPALHKKSVSENDPQNSKNVPERSAPKITSKELFQKLSAGEPLNIFDIRSEDEFQKEHLKNSKNVPLENITSLLEESKFYIIIDDGSSGIARNLAANLGEDESSTNVFYLDGGFQEWRSSNFPTISEGNPNSIEDQSKISYVSSEDLKTFMNDPSESIIIIDVRNPDIFSFEHLKNALNIPLSDIENRESEIAPGKKIVIYDNNGKLSFQAAVRLFDLNIFNVYILSGGLDAWKQKGFEVIH